MAESRIFSEKSGSDLAALEETLNVQQQLLHKLYAELDQEREASETAANEALSMILRLQGEKAAVQMEAKQYKRMAEEKMFHGDECVAMFEDVIYQKDMEIAALECQIEAYKYKLLSLEFNDSDCGETNYPESTFVQKIESLNEEGNSSSEEVKMSNLLPPVYCVAEREKAQADSIDWKNETLFEDSKIVTVGQELKVESADTLDIQSYWQQIKKLDERVKGISDAKDSVKKQPEILQVSKTMNDSECSARVHDIFEVPEVSLSHNDGGKRKVVEPEEEVARGEIRLLRSCSSTDYHDLACAHSAISNIEWGSEVEQLSQRMERLEKATVDTNSRPEITAVGAEEFGSLKMLLYKIQAQLSTLETDIKSLKTGKSKKHDDSALRTIQEVFMQLQL
ncbi:hypothetical protein QQ045_013869 [Rhodiola kirilowii]